MDTSIRSKYHLGSETPNTNTGIPVHNTPGQHATSYIPQTFLSLHLASYRVTAHRHGLRHHGQKNHGQAGGIPQRNRTNGARKEILIARREFGGFDEGLVGIVFHPSAVIPHV